MSRFGDYIKATGGEMRHVKWPTRSQALVYTALVIGISILVALYTAGFDYLFTNLLDLLV